ncbi:chloramphenicol acetyltransferase CAT [Curtobacterium sp. MCSS17_008]|uniref:CatA-like O-acetyltransferase n=1 Tax=Curtobacterium sp. MCSS17_008 TaxID=2175647 RepID=UPI000DA9A9EC|nr:CatA-like O-acetyltransferase [Curtobacterium sp. MCSS17_008]PZF58256.1 chloramphenicol acetyltransferase CAT [Curtobacterium sp. MCSS17_008]
MNRLHPIDLEHWPRAEHFAHYRRHPCAWEMTVDVDVTAFIDAVRVAGVKTYPSQIWVLATVVNRHDEFRMQLIEDGRPAVWDVVHPTFTVFHPDTETFSALVVEYDNDARAFHDAVVRTTETYRDDHRMFPQGDERRDTFDVSTLPRTSFTGFALHLTGSEDHLLPIVTLGRYRQVDGRTLMPMAVRINHAAVDGFHASRFVAEVEELFAVPSWIR